MKPLEAVLAEQLVRVQKALEDLDHRLKGRLRLVTTDKKVYWTAK